MSDYDLELAREILRQIEWSARTIIKRFEPITSPDDFAASEEGREKLDAISMQLIAIGENVKNLDKVTGGSRARADASSISHSAPRGNRRYVEAET
jgi:uncharacterized protein with HEPN domain